MPAQRVVVLDESSTPLGMTSAYARAPRGERADAQQRRNYGKNMTLLAGLRLDGISAPMVIEGAVNTAGFEAFVEHGLLPTLHPGDFVIVDNLAAHKSKKVEGLIAQKDAQILFLPPYSLLPDRECLCQNQAISARHPSPDGGYLDGRYCSSFIDYFSRRCHWLLYQRGLSEP